MRYAFTILVLALGLSNVATAQQPSCPTGLSDDRYGAGPCCTTVVGSPPFDTPYIGDTQGVVMNAQWVRIDSCDTLLEESVEIQITMANPPSLPSMQMQGLIACDDMLFRISGSSVANPSAFSFSIGTSLTSQDRKDWLLGKFTRTWTALNENGLAVRFVRYLIAGDMVVSSGVPPLVPECAAMFANKVMMHGYIDLSCGVEIAEPPQPPFFNASLVLTHYDGCQSHLNTPINLRAISGSSATMHRGISFHLVAPENFDFTAPLLMPATDLDFTGSSLDAVRSTVSRTTIGRPGPQCYYESHFTNAQVGTTSVDCLCGPNPVASRYYHQVNNGLVNCNNVTRPWYNIIVTPEIPTGFLQIHLGKWTNLARYDVRQVYPLPILGTIVYNDICDPAPTAAYHVAFGINTYYSGDDVSGLMNTPQLNTPVGIVPTDTLMDFGNHVDGADNTIVGSPAYTNIIWMLSR